MTASWWTWQQACAWAAWRDLSMVARVAPRDGDNDDTETVEALIAAQRSVQEKPRRQPWRTSFAARHPQSPDPAPDLPPIRGSIEEFQQTINDGLLIENEFHMFEPAVVQRLFPANPDPSERPWWPILHALQYIQRLASISLTEAWDALHSRLINGEVRSRRRNPPSAAAPLGDWRRIEPQEYFEAPNMPAHETTFAGSPIEILGSDVRTYWPALSSMPFHSGPKGGEKSVDREAWEIAERILGDGTTRPPRGHGRLAKLARLVNAELLKRGIERQDDSIRKSIGPGLREWEKQHPEE
jgi:hypothetical protein